ncbi:MAG: hypothetical protein ABIQ95_00775 [Bdellovibrionia bacterium]
MRKLKILLMIASFLPAMLQMVYANETAAPRKSILKPMTSEIPSSPGTPTKAVNFDLEKNEIKTFKKREVIQPSSSPSGLLDRTKMKFTRIKHQIKKKLQH